MKELEAHLNLGTKIELNVKKKQEVEYFLEGIIKPKIGHFIWEINEDTGEVRKADYKINSTIFHWSQTKLSEKLVVNPSCIYIPALNAKNAKKNYLRNKNQDEYFVKEAIMSLKDLPI